jgi:uncharacterized membrane protein YfcA
VLFELLLAVVAVIAGGIASLAGFGIGSLLTPVLALETGMKVAVAAIGVPHLVATALRFWQLRSHVDRTVLFGFGIASGVGGLLGALALARFSSRPLVLVFGWLLVLAGLSELAGWGRNVRIDGGWAIAAGALSGVFGGLVGNQGGIRSAALLRFGLPPQALVATATAVALMVDAARLPAYLIGSGDAIAEHGMLVALLTVAVVVGTLLGVPVLRRLSDRAFRTGLASLLVILGAALIGSVVAG